MAIVRRADVGDAPHVGRFVDALLVELSASPSRYGERLSTANRLLTLGDRTFGYLAFEQEEPIGVIMISESASIYAGGMFGPPYVTTDGGMVAPYEGAVQETKLLRLEVGEVGWPLIGHA